MPGCIGRPERSAFAPDRLTPGAADDVSGRPDGFVRRPCGHTSPPPSPSSNNCGAFCKTNGALSAPQLPQRRDVDGMSSTRCRRRPRATRWHCGAAGGRRHALAGGSSAGGAGERAASWWLVTKTAGCWRPVSSSAFIRPGSTTSPERRVAKFRPLPRVVGGDSSGCCAVVGR